LKTSGEIIFDRDTALAQADKLERLADEIRRRTVRPMENDGQNLHAVWTGSSATAFLRKQQDLRRQIKQTEQELRDIAADIRATARRVYGAEMEAVRIAQSLLH